MAGYANRTYEKFLIDLYGATFGNKAVEIHPLPQAGGNRRYYRLKPENGRTVIGVYGNDVNENKAFIYLDKIFSSSGINVPKIISVSEDYRHYIIEDLGDTSLFSLLHTHEGEGYLEKAVGVLPKLQSVKNVGQDMEYFQPPFAERGIKADLNYFKYCFLKTTGTGFDENLLENDFERLCSDVVAAAGHLKGLMYRDCQSRNIMIHDGDLWWIDFQGARPGPMIYDIVSLLWQAKAGLTPAKREYYLDIYFKALADYRSYPQKYRNGDVGLFALLRTVQVLGAYGFRGLVERRTHFITSITAALANAKELIEEGFLNPYPELKQALCAICSRSDEFENKNTDGKLQVEIYSFSYKKGYPTDFSGNGGGFMFDCRAIHNPGRYEEYKSLTGMDESVRKFLEDDGEVFPFLESAESMVDTSVRRYLKRGFTNLQVGFGCTGGRHRSVYCAEKMADFLKQKYGDAIRIKLCHKEQDISKVI